jgi:hypothetical protein
MKDENSGGGFDVFCATPLRCFLFIFVGTYML